MDFGKEVRKQNLTQCGFWAFFMGVGDPKSKYNNWTGIGAIQNVLRQKHPWFISVQKSLVWPYLLLVFPTTEKHHHHHMSWIIFILFIGFRPFHIIFWTDPLLLLGIRESHVVKGRPLLQKEGLTNGDYDGVWWCVSVRVCVRPWPQSLHDAACTDGEQHSVRMPMGGWGSGRRENHGPVYQRSPASFLQETHTVSWIRNQTHSWKSPRTDCYVSRP